MFDSEALFWIVFLIKILLVYLVIPQFFVYNRSDFHYQFLQGEDTPLLHLNI